MSNKIKTIVIMLFVVCFVKGNSELFKIYEKKAEEPNYGEDKAKEFTSDRQRFNQSWAETAGSKMMFEVRPDEEKYYIDEVLQEKERWVIYLQGGKAFSVSLNEDLEEWKKFDRVRIRLSANPVAEVSIWNDLLNQGVLASSI